MARLPFRRQPLAGNSRGGFALVSMRQQPQPAYSVNQTASAL